MASLTKYDLSLVFQKPNDNPVVAKNTERLASPGEVRSDTDASQTIEGVNW